jgi:hypothetical protein
MPSRGWCAPRRPAGPAHHCALIVVASMENPVALGHATAREASNPKRTGVPNARCSVPTAGAGAILSQYPTKFSQMQDHHLRRVGYPDGLFWENGQCMSSPVLNASLRSVRLSLDIMEEHASKRRRIDPGLGSVPGSASISDAFALESDELIRESRVNYDVLTRVEELLRRLKSCMDAIEPRASQPVSLQPCPCIRTYTC